MFGLDKIKKRDIRQHIIYAKEQGKLKFQPQHYTLKSGKQVLIRPPRIDEAQKLIDLKRSYLKNTKTIPIDLDEYPEDVSQELELITRLAKCANSLLLVAVFDGELIGNIDLNGNSRKKLFHTAMLGMGIDEPWRNQGLGKVLIQSALAWAKSNSPIKIVWLEVYATNELGLNLYTNVGFQQCGHIPNFFKSEERYIDKIQMVIHI